VGGADPVLQMTDQNGNVETQAIDTWKTENLIEFLNEKLVK